MSNRPRKGSQEIDLKGTTPEAYTIIVLTDILDVLEEINSQQNGIGDTDSPRIPRSRKVEQIPFIKTLTALQGATLTERCPFSGYMTEVTISWPGGCRALVDIAIGHGKTHLCPREGYLALDNVTVSYAFNEPVRESEELWVEMINGDDSNSHHIEVTISVREA